ncbi:hypothetical protein [Mycolicibacterium sp.]|uniref:hypothetical protein n=1 Tax=Mycolicibacterium sp. TaxID=2320850 RepID=UPI003D0BB873
MISIALFVAAALTYLLATYWRERAVDDDGVPGTQRRTSYLMFYTVCLTIAAAVMAGVDMISVVLPV